MARTTKPRRLPMVGERNDRRVILEVKVVNRQTRVLTRCDCGLEMWIGYPNFVATGHCRACGTTEELKRRRHSWTEIGQWR